MSRRTPINWRDRRMKIEDAASVLFDQSVGLGTEVSKLDREVSDFLDFLKAA